MIQIDMDMPKNCSSCLFSFGMCCSVKKVDHENYFKAIPKLCFIEARPYWCPLQEVSSNVLNEEESQRLLDYISDDEAWRGEL